MRHILLTWNPGPEDDKQSDDLEIRTLLRAGLTRGQQKVRVVVKNPSPDVHARVRQHIEVNAESDYASV